MVLYVFFLAGWMQSMSEAYSQTMCRTWTQIATTGAVTSLRQYSLWAVGKNRYGYRKCGSDVYSPLDNTKKHMEPAEKRMAFVQDRLATNGLARWPNMLVEATDGGEGGGQHLWKLPSWSSLSVW